jgi:hypothetical protein
MSKTWEKTLSKYQQLIFNNLLLPSQLSWVKNLPKKEAYTIAEKSGYYWHSSSNRWVEVSMITFLFPKKNKPPQKARSRCCDCTLWSGHPGNRKGDLVCAVNPKIQPNQQELEKVCGRIAYAWHDCQDFESPNN